VGGDEALADLVEALRPARVPASPPGRDE
jgi:hypothetical protein